MSVKITAPTFKRNGKTVVVLGTSGKKGKYTHTLDQSTGHVARVKTSHFNRKPLTDRFGRTYGLTGYVRQRTAKVTVEVPDAYAGLVAASYL